MKFDNIYNKLINEKIKNVLFTDDEKKVMKSTGVIVDSDFNLGKRGKWKIWKWESPIPQEEPEGEEETEETDDKNEETAKYTRDLVIIKEPSSADQNIYKAKINTTSIDPNFSKELKFKEFESEPFS